MNIEIKNKRLFIKNAATVSLIVLLFLVFIWGMKINSRLAQELAVKKSEHKEAKSASKRLKAFQKELQNLEQKEKIIGLRVPTTNEKQPFSLIRTLTAIASETGLTDFSFTMKEPGDSATQTSDDALTQGASQSGSVGIQASLSLPPGPKPIRLQMNFAATYQQLLKFLDRLMNLERIVSAQEIKIERDKKELPRQKISLQLVAYVF